MVDPYLEAEPEIMARTVNRHNGTNRVGDPADIADAVTSLLCAQSKFVKGTTLAVNRPAYRA